MKGTNEPFLAVIVCNDFVQDDFVSKIINALNSWPQFPQDGILNEEVQFTEPQT